MNTSSDAADVRPIVNTYSHDEGMETTRDEGRMRGAARQPRARPIAPHCTHGVSIDETRVALYADPVEVDVGAGSVRGLEDENPDRRRTSPRSKLCNAKTSGQLRGQVRAEGERKLTARDNYVARSADAVSGRREHELFG